MAIPRREIKHQTKEQLKGKVFKLFAICLLVMMAIGFGGGICGLFMGISIDLLNGYGSLGIILLVISYITYFAYMLLVAMPMGFGILELYLSVTYGEEPSAETPFSTFKENYSKKVVLVFLMKLYTFLWTSLFVIPGIIKSLSYSQAPLILLENPEMSATEAINASKEMMRGRKWELFVLHLSFIPWVLLLYVTFGLAGIYVVPYMGITLINYYHRIKGSIE